MEKMALNTEIKRDKLSSSIAAAVGSSA